MSGSYITPCTKSLSYMIADVLFNLLNELRNSVSLLRNEFNKFNKTGARMLDSLYHMAFKIFRTHTFGVKTLGFCHMHDVKSVIS